MSKKTQEAKRERLIEIGKHQVWAAQQDPLVRALSTFSKGCFAYGPAPERRTTGDFDHAWVVKRVVLVPEVHCEEQVTIPADHLRIGLVNDHGKLVLVGSDPHIVGTRMRFIEITPDLEVALPGGEVARMRKVGEAYIVEEPRAAFEEARKLEEEIAKEEETPKATTPEEPKP